MRLDFVALDLLGFSLWRQGKNAECQRQLQRSLAMKEMALRKDHTNMKDSKQPIKLFTVYSIDSI